MINSWAEKIGGHKRSLLAIVVGQGLKMLGLAIGTRLLTEAASTSTFGLAKLCLGLVTLMQSIFVRPYNQFTTREYHDAFEAGTGRWFEIHARRIVLVLSALTALLLVIGLLGYRQAYGVPSVLAAVACGVMLVAETTFSYERGMLLTKGRQLSVSVMDSLRFWGLPLAAAGALLLVADTGAVFLWAQATLLCVITLAVYRFTARGSRPVRDDSRGDPAIEVDQARQWNRNARAFALPLLGFGLFQWIVTLSDRYIMAGYLDLDDVGRYTAAYGLASAPMIALGNMAARFLYPLVFRAAARNETRRRRRLHVGQVLVSVSVSVLAVVAVMVFGNLIAAVFLADAYREGARELLVWLTAAHGLLVVSFAFDLDAYASKRTGRVTMAYALAAAVKVAISFVLIPRVGAVGAAQATFAGFAVYLAAMVVFASVGARGAGRAG